MGAVAEGAHLGPAAAAQCDRAAPGVDLTAVLVDDGDVTSDDVGPVAVRGDRASGLRCGWGRLERSAHLLPALVDRRDGSVEPREEPRAARERHDLESERGG